MAKVKVKVRPGSKRPAKKANRTQTFKEGNKTRRVNPDYFDDTGSSK